MLRGPDGASYVANLLLDVSDQSMPWRHRAMLRRMRPPRPILNREELCGGLVRAVRAGAQCAAITPAPREPPTGDRAEARAHFVRVLFGDPSDPGSLTVCGEEWAIALADDLAAAATASRAERAWQRRGASLLALRSAAASPPPGSWAETLSLLAERGDDLLAPIFAFL